MGRTLTIRERAATGVMKQCTYVGAALIANGTGVHAVPTGHLKRYPGLAFMVQRYRDEIMRLLDESVE